MTKRERIEAAIAGKPVDRVPISFWRHFPDADDTAEGLAEAMVQFHRRLDLDFMKVMPSGVYCVEDWGCRPCYEPNANGVKRCHEHPVKGIEDWARIKPLDVRNGALGREVRCLELIRKRMPDDAPVLQTVFSPLTVARKLRGDGFEAELRAHADVMRPALATITETMVAFTKACLAAGADGIFFATQLGTRDLLSDGEYRTHVRPWDLEVLGTLRARAWFSIVHVHGENILFDLFAGYPVQAINWHDRRAAPTLAEAKRMFPGCLIGGLNEIETLANGPDSAIEAQVKDAIAQTDGQGLVVGPGCVVPMAVPETHLEAARRAVEAKPGA